MSATPFPFAPLPPFVPSSVRVAAQQRIENAYRGKLTAHPSIRILDTPFGLLERYSGRTVLGALVGAQTP